MIIGAVKNVGYARLRRHSSEKATHCSCVFAGLFEICRKISKRRAQGKMRKPIFSTCRSMFLHLAAHRQDFAPPVTHCHRIGRKQKGGHNKFLHAVRLIKTHSVFVRTKRRSFRAVFRGAEISGLNFKISGSDFEIRATNFFLAPMWCLRVENQFSIFSPPKR